MLDTIVKGFGKCPKLPWMVEFHSTADGKVFNQQLKAAFAENYLEHLSNLHEKSGVGRKRLTQFLGIIPPKPQSRALEKLLMAGMTAAQVRMAYFNFDDFVDAIKLIKKVVEDFGKKIGRAYPLAIAMDVTEPEITIGTFRKASKGVELEKGHTTKLTTNPEFKNRCSEEYIFVNYEKLPEVVKVGDSVVLGDNQISLSAYEIARDVVECLVEKAGMLVDNLSVKLPNTPVTLPNISEQEKFLKVGGESEIDMIFVGPTVLQKAKEVLGPKVRFILKLESTSAAEELDHYIDQVDGVLIDGEKLMVTSKEDVFILQKSIVAKCNKKGKPVITAINCNAIMKPQLFDIANSVMDGVDALLLPPDPELMEQVSIICKKAECAIYQKQLFNNLINLYKPPIEPIYSLSIAAVEASFNSNATAIILLTTSGRSAKLISMFRPRCPIIALTRFGRIAKQLMLYRGIIPIYYVKNIEGPQKLEQNIQLGMTFGKLNGYIRMGDAVVIVFGIRHAVGFKNCLEVVYASEYDTIPPEQEPRRSQ